MPGHPALRIVRRWAVVATLWVVPTTAAAHVPFFPPNDAPVPVDTPTISKAFYLRSTPGTPHTFVVDPVARRIPVQLLVLDDDLGRSLAFDVEVACDDTIEIPTSVQVEFYEPFSRIDHLIVAAGGLGPSERPCIVTVTQTAGPVGPYTFSIGDEERFGPSAMASMLTLRRDLDRWRSSTAP